MAFIQFTSSSFHKTTVAPECSLWHMSWW